jgi:hypothetical protein
MRPAAFALLLCACSPAAMPDDHDEPSLAHPPTRPARSSNGETRWFVVRRWHLGIARRDGTPDHDAWRTYGYDLDGRNTTREEIGRHDVPCLRRNGSVGSSHLLDGDRGIDNNLAKTVMSRLHSMMPSIEDETNARIEEGRYTVALRLENVGPRDNAHVPGALWLVGERGKTDFSSTEKWPIAADTAQPLQSFPDGYMRGGWWVSTDDAAASALVPVPVLGDALVLPLQHAVVTVHVASGGVGTIAGALPPAELSAVIAPSLQRRGLCRDTYSQMMFTIAESADLLLDRASGRRICDATSVGLGFDLAPIAGLDGTTGAPPPAIPACN